MTAQISSLKTKNSSIKQKQEERGQKPQKKESHPMASFAEAPAGDVAKGTRYTGFLLVTFLPSFVFLHVTRFTDVLSLFLFYFLTHRREDFQDEVRAVPRRRTGGRTQTGTRVCFRRHLFSDRLWSV